MPVGHHPEHAVKAYQDERPSITRLILEARWAHYRLTDALERDPDGNAVPALRRRKLVHAGALVDVLALRSRDPDLYEAARDHGAVLREVDGLALDDRPVSGLDHLRAQYARLDHHIRGDIRRAPHTPDGSSPPPQRPCHRSGPRLVRQMLDTYTWANLGRIPCLPAVDVDSEQRHHLIARGLLLDWAANSAPTDKAAATAAAHAGHALRVLDRRTALSDHCARAYLRDAFRDLDDQEDDDAHPRDCAGRCYGTGEVLTVLTWEHHGDGIYTPVHQEPVLCFGTPTAHAPDCATCKGHGFTYTPRYRELCLDGHASDNEPGADDGY